MSYLKEIILDEKTAKSGIKIRRLDEAATSVPQIAFRKEANIAAHAILKEVERFLRKAHTEDPDTTDEFFTKRMSRKEYVAGNVGHYSEAFYDEFCKSVEQRLDALIKSKHET